MIIGQATTSRPAQLTSPMAARVYAHDWAGTGLGDIASWPASLRVSVNLILASDFPSCLFWGPDMLMIYNDAYLPLMGQKPDALGRPLAVVWSEIWDDIVPILDRAWQGSSTFIEDFPLMVDRDGQMRSRSWVNTCNSSLSAAENRAVSRMASTFDVVSTTVSSMPTVIPCSSSTGL